MAESVATVWVPVDDMDRALRFYTDTLHLKEQKRTPEWSEVDAGGLTIGLNAREGTAAHADGGAVITFTPEGSIDAEVERLSGEGIDFPGGISDHPWGRIAPWPYSERRTLARMPRRVWELPSGPV